MPRTPNKFLNPERDIPAVRRISDFYKLGADEIRQVHNSIDPLELDRQAVEEEVRLITNDLTIGTKEWIDEEFPEIYFIAAIASVKKLNKILKENKTFTPTDIDNISIQNIADGTLNLYKEALSGVNRKTSTMLDKVVADRISFELSKNTAKPITPAGLKETVKKTIEDAGVGSLTDKSGKTWQLDTYAEMVARTENTKITNEATANQALKEGLDLVYISNHSSSCDSCGPLEGKVYSLTGATPGYPILEEATAGTHMFGPNCKHTFTPISEKDAKNI